MMMSNIWSFVVIDCQSSSNPSVATSVNLLESGIRRKLLDSSVEDNGGIVRLIALEPLLSNSVAIKGEDYVVPEFVEFASGEFFKPLGDFISITDVNDVDRSKNVRLGLEKVEPEDYIANVLIPGPSPMVLNFRNHDFQASSRGHAITI